MPTRLLCVTALFLLTLAAPASAVIVPGKGMAGAELGQCIEDVIEVVGYPDLTFGKEAPTGEFVETYTYKKRGLKIRFYHGPGECLVAGEFLAYKGSERTAEGIGKGTMRKTIKAKLGKRVKCETFKFGKRRIRSCHIGKFTPSKPVTEFRIDSKGRVATVSVRYVSD
jgi:hypothetical protein